MPTPQIGRENVGRIAERIVANELEYCGFKVRDLNLEGLAANVDLLAVKDGNAWQIQVKGSSYDTTKPTKGWWFQYGYCAEEHIQNKNVRMFNRIPGSFQTNIVAMVCVRSPNEYQCIILPVFVAEKAAQINLDFAYRTKKSDGSSKKPNKVWFTLYPTKAKTAFANEQILREQELVRPFLLDRSQSLEPENRIQEKSLANNVLSKVFEESKATTLVGSLRG